MENVTSAVDLIRAATVFAVPIDISGPNTFKIILHP